MNEFRVACHIYTWEGITSNVLEPVFRQVAEADYEGVEGLSFSSAEDLVQAAAAARAWGLHIVNARARTPSQEIAYNAALGNAECEIWEGPIEDFGGPDLPRVKKFPLVASFFEPLIKEASRFKIKLCHHVHLGQLVETEDDIDLLVKHMPDMGLAYLAIPLISIAAERPLSNRRVIWA